LFGRKWYFSPVKRTLACLLLVAAGCRDQSPPAPTKAQSAQLNDAEAMLNEAANEEGPADRSTGPSNSSD
jgi:hypothetical protein